jgi:hypothetical protein
MNPLSAQTGLGFEKTTALSASESQPIRQKHSPAETFGPRDGAELGSRERLPARPAFGLGPSAELTSVRPSELSQNPRPWPVQPDRASALSELGHRLLPDRLGQFFEQAHQAEAGPFGWSVPANPERSPLQIRDPWAVQLGGLDGLRIVPNNWGRLRRLRLQWPEQVMEPAISAQRALLDDMLRRLPGDVQFEVVAQGLGAQQVSHLLEEHPRVKVHPLDLPFRQDMWVEPLTMWARDGALLLQGQEGFVVALPSAFRGHGQIDPKLNRMLIQGSAVAPVLGSPAQTVRRSHLHFEGGDVIASRQRALVGLETVAQNMHHLKLTRAQVVEQFEKLLGVAVLVVEPQPAFHIDLGFTWLEEGVVAVADPSWGIRLVQGLGLDEAVKATQEAQLQSKYERAAAALSAQGLEVVKLPHLAGVGLRSPYFTYNNVLMEVYSEVRRVYMPSYGVISLDEAARSVYQGRGYQVVDMPSARLTTPLWGSVRCATGELEVEC